MVYELEETTKVEALFAGWEETLIWSCLQTIVGAALILTCLEE